jgi:hypothetical protein
MKKNHQHRKTRLAGVGIEMVKLDMSNSTPRIRFPNHWSVRLNPTDNWRQCYLGKGQIGLVSLCDWDRFCKSMRRKFEQENPNTRFDEWVEDPAKDARILRNAYGMRLCLDKNLLSWAKIPLEQGTKLLLFRRHFWIVISLPENSPYTVA